VKALSVNFGHLAAVCLCLMQAACHPAQESIDIFGNRLFTLEDEKYRPIAYYRSFPIPVQRLLQHIDIEQEQCRGGSGDDPETLRACNRGSRLAWEAEKQGWCWNSSEGYGYTNHWMRCADVPNSGAAEPVRPPQYFTSAEIAALQRYTPAKLKCRDEPTGLPPSGSHAVAEFDIFGSSHLRDADYRDNPEAEYTSFPVTVRSLLRQHDLEVSKASDTDVIERHRAFNRRNRLLAQIEDRGWCWGSKDHLSSSDRWMKCTDIAGYTSNQPKADSALFSLEDMRKTNEDARKHCL
jgi:hypothetical protein